MGCSCGDGRPARPCRAKLGYLPRLSIFWVCTNHGGTETRRNLRFFSVPRCLRGGFSLSEAVTFAAWSCWYGLLVWGRASRPSMPSKARLPSAFIYFLGVYQPRRHGDTEESSLLLRASVSPWWIFTFRSSNVCCMVVLVWVARVGTGVPPVHAEQSSATFRVYLFFGCVPTTEARRHGEIFASSPCLGVSVVDFHFPKQ